MDEITRERRWGWCLSALAIVIVMALQGFLASRLSLWSDEFSAIEPALRPWSGEHDFWWQIRQYIANPPGENLVLRILYRSSSLAWLRESSREFFWRLPYLFAYAASALVTYFYAEKWSRSPLIGSVFLAFFLAAPGPFVWATETRFYAWAILFVTLCVWEGILFIEGDFAPSNYIRLSIYAAVGVIFHISLALICGLLVIYALTASALTALKWRRATHRPTRAEIIKFFSSAGVGFFPYLIYRYERIQWMFVPGGVGYFPVFSKTLSQAFREVPKLTGILLPFGSVWSTFGCILFVLGLLLISALGWFRRDFTRGIVSTFLLSVSVGGSFLVLLSANSNQFTVTSRHFLFAVPAFLAGAGYLVFDRFRDRVTSVPFPARIMAIMIALSIGIGGSFSLAKETLGHGSPAKINHDLAFFRSLYVTLPDRRPLVLVGVGEGALWATTDTGDFIGATFVPYLSDFSPHYLSSRLPPAWEIPTTSAGWKNYDFLVFVPPGREPRVPNMDWSRVKCVVFSWGLLRFCRAR